MVASRILRRRPDGLNVYGYESSPGRPPVGTVSLTDELVSAIPYHDHTHDFFVLVYFTGSRGVLRRGSSQLQVEVEAGDLHLIAPGEAVGIIDIDGLRAANGRIVFFPLDAVTAIAELNNGPGPESFLSWRLHPLLSPFATDPGTGARRLQVPVEDRPRWTAHLDAIDHELDRRAAHYRDATIALLRLLLIDLARLLGAHGGAETEPVVDEVLRFIDRHYREPISLRDVARAVSLSPGHLTTVVGSRTSHTVQQWITERRMAEARNLLDRTEIAVQEVGRRVGYRDPSFFARTFRQNHGISPLAWRRAGRV